MLATISRQLSCRYTVEGAAQSSLALFAPDAFLPVLAFHASVRAKYLLGNDLGVDIRSDPQALLGVYAEVAPVRDDPQSVVRALFFMDAMKKVFGVHDGDGGRWLSIECQPVFDHYKNGFLEGGVLTEKSSWPLAEITSQR